MGLFDTQFFIFGDINMKKIIILSFLMSSSTTFAAPTLAQLWGDKTDVTVSLGVKTAPRYLGSKDQTVSLLPNISAKRGIFYANALRGVGAQYLNDSGLYTRAGLGYDLGRTEENDSFLRDGSDRLLGMGKIKPSATMNAMVAKKVLANTSIIGEVNFAIAGQNKRGHDFRVGTESIVFKNNKNDVNLGVNAYLGDKNFNRTYFGVNAEQSVNSAYAQHTAKSGIYAYSLKGDWTYKINNRWSVYTLAEVKHLAGSAKNSPIVGRATGIAVSSLVNYAF